MISRQLGNASRFANNMNYELTLDRFKGPFPALLELIEERKLSISEISLAEVTDDFLRYLEKIKAAAEQELLMNNKIDE